MIWFVGGFPHCSGNPEGMGKLHTCILKSKVCYRGFTVYTNSPFNLSNYSKTTVTEVFSLLGLSLICMWLWTEVCQVNQYMYPVCLNYGPEDPFWSLLVLQRVLGRFLKYIYCIQTHIYAHQSTKRTQYVDNINDSIKQWTQGNS